MTFHEVPSSSSTFPLWRKWLAEVIPIIFQKSSIFLRPSTLFASGLRSSLLLQKCIFALNLFLFFFWQIFPCFEVSSSDGICVWSTAPGGLLMFTLVGGLPTFPVPVFIRKSNFPSLAWYSSSYSFHTVSSFEDAVLYALSSFLIEPSLQNAQTLYSWTFAISLFR